MEFKNQKKASRDMSAKKSLKSSQHTVLSINNDGTSVRHPEIGCQSDIAPESL
jgi:hypothetical protein